ncbi:MAG: BspA family leucine-rich repeat surface protein [Bacteroidota bacterium]
MIFRKLFNRTIVIYFFPLLFILFSTGEVNAQAFITTWQTSNPGTSNNDQITIPTTGGGYNYDIDWGDGTNDAGVTGSITHTFPAPGTYTVSITGSFPRIFFNNGGDRQKILTVEQWGSISWSSMNSAFFGCSNLTVPTTDSPDLSGVLSLGQMFQDATSFNQSIDSWDVSNTTIFTGMFRGATSFDQPLNSWNIDAATNISFMFDGATDFNQPLSNWNTTGVTIIEGMFRDATSFNQNVNTFDVSLVQEFNGVFQRATSFNQPLNNWNTGSATRLEVMFSGATLFNQPIKDWDVSNVQTMNFMFLGASSFNQDLGNWNIESLTTATDMFFNTGLSTVNYDKTLIGWATLGSSESQIPINISSFRSLGLTFCLGNIARQSLVDDFGWSITNDNLNCSSLQFLDYSSPIDINSGQFLQSQNITAIINDPEDLDFNAFGTSLYILGSSGTIAEFSLSVPFDISTANPTGVTVDLSGQDALPTAIEFSPDGTVLFLLGDLSNSVLQFNLTSPFNITSAITPAFNFLTTGQSSFIEDIKFDNTGTQMYVLEDGSGTFNRVFQYSLSVPFEISSASFSGTSFNFSNEDTNPQAIAFNANGLKLFMTGFDTDAVNEYSLSSPFDISSAIFTDNPNFLGNSFSIRNEIVTTPSGLVFSTDGTQMFVSGRTGVELLQYELSTNPFLESPANDGSLQGSLIVSIQGDMFSNPGGNLFSPGSFAVDNLPSDFSAIATVSADGITAEIEIFGSSLTGVDADDISNLIFTFQNSAFTSGNASAIASSTDASSFLGADFEVPKFLNYSSIRLETRVFSGNELDVSPTIFPQDVTFDRNGTRMFVAGQGQGAMGGGINVFSLTAPFDINSVSSVESFDFPTVGGFALFTTFNLSGTRMFTATNIGTRLQQFDLTTPFDLNTAVFAGKILDIDPISVSIQDVAFSSSGLRMYILNGDSPASVIEYSLGSPFDLLSITELGRLDISGEDTGPLGFAFNSSGSKLFVAGTENDAVYEYSLSSSFDLSTAVFTGNLSPLTPDILVPNGIAFNSTGDRMFITEGGIFNDINQFDLSSDAFTENVINDGSVSGQIDLAISGDVFSSSFIAADFTIGNLPAGLTPVISSNTDSQSAILTLSGNAINNDDSDDIANLQFTFNDIAFFRNSAASIENTINANSNLGVDFLSNPLLPEIAIFEGPDNSGTEIFDGVTVIDFGSIVVGSNVDFDFTIENTGNTDLNLLNITVTGTDFGNTIPTTMVGAGSTENFSVSFSASTTGTFTETVTIETDDADEAIFTFDITIQVTATPEPEIAVFAGADNTGTELTDGQAAPVDFGSTLQGTDLNFTFTIENIGSADLNLNPNDFQLSGSAFSFISFPQTVIAPGASDNFIMQLSGAVEGTFTESVGLDSNDPDEGVFNFTISGVVTGAMPEALIQVSFDDGSSLIPLSNNSSTPIQIGQVEENETILATFIIENTGSADLNLSSVISSSSNFQVDFNAGTLAPVATTQFLVTVQQAAGIFNTDINIINNSVNAPSFIFPIEAIFLAETFEVIFGEYNNGVQITNNQADDIDVGSTPINVERTETFTINNIGQVDLVINSITFSDPNFEARNVPDIIPANQLAGFQIVLLATTAGQFSSDVALSTSAGDFEFGVTGEVLEDLQIEVVNAVAPAGTAGVNDFLEITNLPNDNFVTIYNRWGDQVFEMENYSGLGADPARVFNGERNTNGSGNLPSGTYYYLIRTRSEEINGFMVLRR